MTGTIIDPAVNVATAGVKRAQRCAMCGETLRAFMNADYFLLRHYEEESDQNDYVQAFRASPLLKIMVSHPLGLYHRLLENKHLRKEATESWAIFERIKVAVTAIRARTANTNIVIVDLCCGNSLTTTLCGYVVIGPNLVTFICCALLTSCLI